jgi:hypothetical protein
MKKCPPGVICVENISLTFIIICILLLGYLIYMNTKQNNTIINNRPSEKIIIKDNDRENLFSQFLPSWPYTNLPSDPLLNPYSPPLRDERYFVRGALPINISTNIGAVDTQYRQLGIMTANNTKGKIIPLMGRPLFTNRDKWQYYTMSPEGNNNSIKLY